MWMRVSALVLRYLYLYRRSFARAGEVFFWPVMDLLVWGFLTTYLQRHVVPGVVMWLLGSLIFWDILYRSQQAITLSLTEEIWVKNILNLFISPISAFEMLLATCLMGVIKAAITAVVLGSLALLFYAFDLTKLGIMLVPYIVILLLFGWAMGMFTMGLILRFGQAAEALVWGVPFIIQPLSAVFYPVGVLPQWLQRVAYVLPSTHVFEGMREVLATGSTDVRRIGLALALNVVYLVAGGAFFAWVLRSVREKGYLSRLGME